MAVSIIPKFTSADIKKVLQERMDRIEKAILTRLKRIGEQFVKNARTNGNYVDRTGNLRSSIGYVILRNGEQFAGGSFKQIKTGSDGIASGNKVLSDAMQNFPKGYVLIVVAGMHYAAAVEAKGKDVLTGSSQIATRDLKIAMDGIRSKIEKM